MDDSSKVRHIPRMGVSKMSKNIRKSPLHQPNFVGSARDQPPPQVYNINKNDFRDIVQQLTGSPLRDPPLRPTQNTPKAPNNRLQRIRPPPLAPANRPQLPPIHHRLPMSAPRQPLMPPPHGNNSERPHGASHYGQPPQNTMLPSTPTDIWENTAESPVTAYARYLQDSIIDPGPWQHQYRSQPNMKPQVEGQSIPQPRLLRNHNPVVEPFPPPRANGYPSNLPSPRTNVLLDAFPSSRMNGLLPSPTPWMNGHAPPPLLSPTSQFLLPSPTGFLNLLSPRSPHTLLSPRYHPPPPVSPNFSFSSVPHSGILGPGPPLPPSPGYGFPLSPGFFPASSPRWRD